MPLVKKQAVILIGPPGSGKGTQAELVAEKFGLVHLESSKIIEEKFQKANPADKLMVREKENWLKGKLVNQTMVASWLIGEIEKTARMGKGIVLSGSPRSSDELEGELPIMEELYGKDNIRIIHIKLSEEESVKRNSERRICESSRHPIPNTPENASLTVCPQDGSKLITRGLDKPETIKERYRVYFKETNPILSHFVQHGYKVIEINGERPIEKVKVDIFKALNE